MKLAKLVPIKVKNDCSGQCDGCGEDLGAWKWRLGESTGCTRKCVLDDIAYDQASTLSEGVDYSDRFGDES